MDAPKTPDRKTRPVNKEPERKKRRAEFQEPEPTVWVCQGCLEHQPNQMAHYGGCLQDPGIPEDFLSNTQRKLF